MTSKVTLAVQKYNFISIQKKFIIVIIHPSEHGHARENIVFNIKCAFLHPNPSFSSKKGVEKNPVL